ncbi:MAG: LysE family translocator [Pseudomonadota bacterium]
MADYATFVPGFLAAYAILLVAASSPGPAVAMLIGIASEEGRGPALMATFGIATGSLILNVATLLGMGLLLAQASWALSAVRIAGAAYLLYLAYGAFRKALRPPQFEISSVQPRAAWKHFLSGYLIQVSNPKAIAFWVAIASVGATQSGGPVVILAFVIGAFAISFLCHGAWAVALSSGPARKAYTQGRRWIELGLGGFLTFAAFRLATSRD